MSIRKFRVADDPWTRRAWLRGFTTLALCAAILLPPLAQAEGRAGVWLGTWAASPQGQDPFTPAVPAQFVDQTVRQIVRSSVGGSEVRVRLSNEFGSTPLVIGSAAIARHAEGAAIVAGSSRALTFGGKTSITIPAGAPALSDPVSLEFPALADLAVSIYLPATTPVSTFHSLGLSTSYLSPQGDHAQAVVMPTSATAQSWYFLSGISVRASKRQRAIVAIGDSITDGFASTPDTNARWPNVLAARLQARRSTDHLAVLNQGISGNRTQFDVIGPNALARFDRDVLLAPGAAYVILLEGINNIGLPGAFGFADQQLTADEIIAGHRQFIARAQARGLKIFGGTLTPFEGTSIPGYYTPEGEAKRQAVNAWIRGSGEFDGVIDFDLALQDPAHPTRMLPAYDSGDHLHPSDAGYDAMAKAIDLRLFRTAVAD